MVLSTRQIHHFPISGRQKQLNVPTYTAHYTTGTNTCIQQDVDRKHVL